MANNLAATLSLIKNSTDSAQIETSAKALQNLYLKPQTIQSSNEMNIWTVKQAAQQKPINNNEILQLQRRISGSSSLGSTGNGKHITGTNGSRNSSASFASTSVSSSEEFWPIQQQQLTATTPEQQQNFSRLPIFEQLSNSPF